MICRILPGWECPGWYPNRALPYHVWYAGYDLYLSVSPPSPCMICRIWPVWECPGWYPDWALPHHAYHRGALRQVGQRQELSSQETQVSHFFLRRFLFNKFKKLIVLCFLYCLFNPFVTNWGRMMKFCHQFLLHLCFQGQKTDLIYLIWN